MYVLVQKALKGNEEKNTKTYVHQQAKSTKRSEIRSYNNQAIPTKAKPEAPN